VELGFSVHWLGCRTFKHGIALAHVTYYTIQIKCDSFQKKVSVVVAIRYVIFCKVYSLFSQYNV